MYPRLPYHLNFSNEVKKAPNQLGTSGLRTFPIRSQVPKLPDRPFHFLAPPQAVTSITAIHSVRESALPASETVFAAGSAFAHPVAHLRQIHR